MSKNYPKIEIEYSVLNKAFKSGIKENNKEIDTLNKGFRLQREEMKHTSSESEKLQAELNKLNREYELSAEKTRMTASALENTKAITGENSAETKKWSDALLVAQKNEAYLKNKIIETNVELTKATEKESEATKASEKRQETLKGLESQQDALKTSSERLTKEYELQVSELGNNAKESDKAKLQQKALAEQMKNSAEQTKNLEQQLKVSKEEFGENSAEVKKLENELLDAKIASQEFANAFQDSTNSLKNWGGKLQTYGSELQNIGKGLTIGVTAPLVAVGGASVKMASDFESAAAGMRKTNDELVDANGKVIISYKDLEDGIRDMSKEIPASAKEIAGVAETAGQLGIQTESVLEFSRTMIDMGQATNMSSEEAATAMARLANITQMSQKDFDKLGSTIVDLGNHFATMESEITAMGLRLSGIGNQIGMSEADIMGLSTAMSALGVEVEAGGTAMTQGLKKMQNAVAGNTEELQLFAQTANMSAEEFAEAFSNDPITALEAYVTGLQEASENGENLNDILADVGITGIREADTFLRLAGNSELLGEAVSTANNAWAENVALTEEVEKRYETFESKLSILKNQIVDIGIEMGGPLMDALSTVLDAMQPVLEVIGDLATKFSDADPKLQQLIITIGAIVAGVGPLVGVIGTILVAIGGIMTLIGTGAAMATGLLLGIPLLIAAVASLVAAIVIYWDDIVDATKNMIDAVIGFFKGIGEWFSGFFGGLKEGWDNWIESLLESTGKAWDGLKQGFSNVGEWFSNLFEGIAAIFNSIKESVVSKFKEIVASVIEFGAMLLEAVTPFFTRLGEIAMVPVNLIMTLLEGLFLFIKAGIDILLAVFEAMFDKMAIFYEEKVKVPVQELITFIIELFQAFLEKIQAFFDSVWQIIVMAGQKIKQSMIDPIVEAVAVVIEKVIELRDKLFAFLGEILQKFIDIFTRMKNAVVSKFTEMKDAVFNKVSEIASGISNGFEKAITKTGEVFTKIKDAALKPMIDLVDGVKNAIDNIKDFFFNIKLPTFGLKMGSKNVLGKNIEYPTGIDVQWREKGAIFQKPTIFGMANGLFQGAGEAGEEAVLPLNASTLGGIGEGIVNHSSIKQMFDSFVNGLIIQNHVHVDVVSEMDGKKMGRGSATYIDDEFNNKSRNEAFGTGRRRR